jgi:hypothetical protein
MTFIPRRTRMAAPVTSSDLFGPPFFHMDPASLKRRWHEKIPLDLICDCARCNPLLHAIT